MASFLRETQHAGSTAARPRFWKYFARLVGFGVIALLLVLLALEFIAAWIYSYAVLHPGCIGDRASLEEAGYTSEAVEFPAPDGTMRRGWLTRGSKAPGAVIIVLPGHAGNTRYALPDAAILAEEGFGTLVFEHRSCADSRLIASTGYYEAQDIVAAVAYLQTRPGVQHIGVIGESEGGTAAVLAAAQEPGIGAVVDMGGYADLTDDILDPQAQKPLPEALFRRMIVSTMSAQLGVPTARSSPKSVIASISPRPVFLIYGEYEAAAGQALYAAAQEPSELWIVPGAGHTGYRWVVPAEYRERIAAFFDAALDLSR